jgi:hypothetical protein
VSVLVVLAGCAASPGVETDYDPAWKYDGYRNFAFVSDKPLIVGVVVPVNPALEKSLMAATRRALEDQGYRFTNRSEADFAVGFMLGTRPDIKVANFPGDEDEIIQGGWTWGGPRREDIDVRDTTEGLLSIDVFDVATRKGVWHGWTAQAITDSDRLDPSGTINVVVRRILEGFPPP